ncbi:MAG: hypothetical protein PHO15_10215, partial [Eubacteriales bacterium]|nr:hypothetical protein [Eubacteriales bacterium]
MPIMTIASEIAFAIAAMEAKTYGFEKIEVEHLFIGLCKIVDMEDEYLINNLKMIGQGGWEDVREEIDGFRELLESSGADCKRLRRRLRYLLKESHEKNVTFSGHRSD